VVTTTRRFVRSESATILSRAMEVSRRLSTDSPVVSDRALMVLAASSSSVTSIGSAFVFASEDVDTVAIDLGVAALHMLSPDSCITLYLLVSAAAARSFYDKVDAAES
jgi:hypothetical protein